jgi:hypothetical protein
LSPVSRTTGARWCGWGRRFLVHVLGAAHCSQQGQTEYKREIARDRGERTPHASRGTDISSLHKELHLSSTSEITSNVQLKEGKHPVHIPLNGESSRLHLRRYLLACSGWRLMVGVQGGGRSVRNCAAGKPAAL